MTNISSWTDLATIALDLTEDYILTTDLSSADADYIGIGDDWEPIGDLVDYFSGTLNGDNHTISNLTINIGNPSVAENTYAGLFGAIYGVGASVTNLILKDMGVDISNNMGISFAGCVACYGAFNMDNVHVTGNSHVNCIYGNPHCYMGGLVAMFYKDSVIGPSSTTITVNNCSSTAHITNEGTVRYVICGGLFGQIRTSDIGDYIIVKNCYCTGNIDVGYRAYDTSVSAYCISAGFSGYVFAYKAGSITVDNCHCTGNVTTHEFYTNNGINTSGFAVYVYAYKVTGTPDATVTNCYCTGNVTITDSRINGNGASYIGGFCGFHYTVYSGATTSINKCYCTGDINYINSTMPTNGDPRTGGFCGHLNGRGFSEINDCYCTGDISPNIGTRTGRFLGWEENNTSITNCGVLTGGIINYDIGAPRDRNFTAGEGSANKTSDKTDFYNINWSIYNNWDIILEENHDGSESAAVWFINGVDYPHLWYEYIITTSYTELMGIIIQGLTIS